MDEIEAYSYSDVKKEYFPNYTSKELIEELYTPYEPIDLKIELKVRHYYCKKCTVAKTLPQYPFNKYGNGICRNCINKQNLKLNKIRTHG
mgnify:CR=1 FL=1|tara:strand:+ start:3046 stop:3315 length:270 start_codon:yes stop_codon:yes gene_type:complete